jgi:hypothetical protein
VLDSYSLITKNKLSYGQFIAMRDGLEVKLELLRCNEIEGIQVGKKLSKNTTKGDQELNLFTTKNGISNC